jgi:hypothetical protein
MAAESAARGWLSRGLTWQVRDLPLSIFGYSGATLGMREA